jgi:DNA-binding SARP family transcriptional activator
MGSAPALRIGRDGQQVELPDGRCFDFGRRVAPRRLLLALALARHEHPGRVLGPEELIAAGWPDERMRPEAARQRLRTAIWTLRKLGLEPLLRTRDDGYLLDPHVPLVWR